MPQVRKTYYNDTGMTTQNAIANAFAEKPEKITPSLIHLAGKEKDKFPLTWMTQGMGNVDPYESKKQAYEYDVKVRARKTRPLLSSPAGTDKVGLGFSKFKLVFPDQWFIKDYVLTDGVNTQVRIMEEPYAGEGGYVYLCQIVGNDPSEFIPASSLGAGKLWAQMFAAVGQSLSRGNKSNWEGAETIRHKLTTVRKSYHMDGNAPNYVADFNFKTNKGTTNMWMDWEEYTHYISWLEECEMYYWYGKQNYDESGHSTMVDERGQPVVIGPGIFDQVQNTDTYSILSENKIKNIIGDVFYGMTDGDNRKVTLYTGLGGMEEFDNAMKAYLNDNEYAKFNDGVFVNDKGGSLSLGKYFTIYRHNDGHEVTVARVNLFDMGAKAQASPKHPISGKPIESYKMVFIDQTQYEGENNLQMIVRKGRSMKRWATAGSTVPNGFQGQKDFLRSSDIDGFSVHFLKEAGVILKRFDTSIILECKLS